MTTTLIPAQPAARAGRWLAPVGSARARPPHAQGTLALSFPLPNGLGAAPAARPLSLVPAQPSAAAGLPDPAAWASRFVQAVMEVVSHDRPLPQLARWTNGAVYAEIGRIQRSTTARRSAARGRPLRQHVASVRVCRPDDLTAEVAARVVCGHRSRAVAARLEFERGRWTCTALTLG